MMRIQLMLCRITCPSLLTSLLVETPTLAVCGAIGLPTSAPTELIDGSISTGRFRHLPVMAFNRSKHGVRGRIASGQGDADPSENRREDDEKYANLRNSVRQRVGHPRVNKDVRQCKDKKSHKQRAPHLMKRSRENFLYGVSARPQDGQNHKPGDQCGSAPAE